MSIRVAVSVLVAVSGLVAAGTAWARDAAMGAGGHGARLAIEAGPRLVPSVGVSREGDVVIYSVTLQNPSNVEVRDVDGTEVYGPAPFSWNPRECSTAPSTTGRQA